MRPLARIFGAAACLLAAVFAATLGWVGAEATGPQARFIAERTGYAPAVYAYLEAMRTDPSSSPPTLDQISQLLRRAPLSDGAMGMAGFAALNAGALGDAARRFSEAIRRNPRNEAARIWLADRAMTAGDAAQAIAHLESLMRLDRERTEIWLRALATVANSPTGLAALEAHIRASDPVPGWAPQLIARLNASPALSLETLTPLNRLTSQTQAGFLQRVDAERGTKAAYQAWRAFSFEEGAGAVDWPYDPLFQSMPGSAPFNWSLRNNLAEFAQGGGLEVTYLGRGVAPYADQVMLLDPGRYRFEARLSGEGSANGGGFAWQMSCKAPSISLGKVDIHDLGPANRVYSFDFSVPDTACDAQVLILRGAPGEFPVRARAKIESVAIKRLSDAPR